jgi:heme exporter protein B
MSAVKAIFLKELRVEVRNVQAISSYLLLTVLILATFRFAFAATDPPMDQIAAPILWITIFFCGMFSLTPTYKREVENETLDGLLLAPISRSSIFFGKLLATLVVIFGMEFFAIFLFFGFFPVEVPDLLALFALVAIGTFGFVALSNLISAISANTSLGAIILFVLMIPILLFSVVMSAVGGTARIFAGDGIGEVVDELRLLTAFAVIFFATGYLLIEYVLGD